MPSLPIPDQRNSTLSAKPNSTLSAQPNAVFSAQPSSLTKPGARNGETCESCGSVKLTSLAMTLTDGTQVDFTSCHNCEHRTWTHDGGSLALTDVLSRATKVK